MPVVSEMSKILLESENFRLSTTWSTGAMELVKLVFIILLSTANPYSTFHIQTKLAEPFITHTHMFIHSVTILVAIPDQFSHTTAQHSDKP